VARAFCLLIVIGLFQTLFGGELFWFSYKIVTSNSVAIYEEKNITPVMIPFEGKSQKLCTLPLQKPNHISTHQFLIQHFDTLLPCFYPLAVHLLSWNERDSKNAVDQVELIIQPVHFTVDFKDEFATINAIR